MKNNLKVIIGYVLAIVVIVGVIAMIYRSTSSKTEVITYDKVVAYFQKEEVREFEIDNKNNLTMLLYQYELDENGQPVTDENGNRVFKKRADGSPDTIRKTYKLARVDYFHEDLGELIKEQIASGVLVGAEYEPAESIPFWLSYLPGILLVVVLIFLYWRAMKTMMSGAGPAGKMNSFGKSHVRLPDDKNRVTFRDVAGADEEKAELVEIVEYLKAPQKFARLGAKIPHGVLLMGPPGTGKTLLAKAVAGEAGVPFFSMSGSDFVELYVGVGASRVRDLFDTARKAGNAIIFIDEIDAVGRQRGTGLGGGHDEREQTLNQLLVEMDGFGNNEGVIVMAATNRADILDNALLRPGRFDRQVYVGMPDIKGREAILKIHARGKPLADDVDLKSIAKGTPGFSGADLENLMNEAALLAVRRKHRFITMEDCDEAILKVEMGPEKKSRKMSDKAKRLTAYHESGHAITSKFLQHTDPVHYITIIPRGMAGGFTLYRPDEDTEDFTSKAQMFERIVSCLGGRIAEKLFLDDISTGASGDIQQATSIARNMVTRYGMSEKLGPIQYDSSDHSIFIGRDFGQTKSYSEETAALIDEEVKRIFDEASVLCEKILTEHRDTLIGVAEYLLENESMDRDTFDYYCEHGTFPEPKPAPAMQDDTIERPARKIARFDDPPTEDASAGMADEPDDGDKH